jgi:myo-inositol-1(or 4)-monophosphatase
MKVSQSYLPSEAFVATGFFAEDEEQLNEQLPAFESLVRRVRAIRRAGAAAYDLALVARGIFDAFWEQGLKPWDTAAGSLLVEEAGGVVQTYRGKPFHPKYNSIVAGSPPIVKEVQNTIAASIRSTTD